VLLLNSTVEDRVIVAEFVCHSGEFFVCVLCGRIVSLSAWLRAWVVCSAANSVV
jgi:hypothetical protein